MNTLRLLLSSLVMMSSAAVFGQGAKNIVISEVQTDNSTGIVDEFGQHHAWIELANTSFSTYNVRGMYVTTCRDVLNKTMSAPERIKLMSKIPNGEDKTNLGARKHLLLYCNSNPSQGKLHFTVDVNKDKPTWIAIYNGNAVELIDSVTVPVLNTDESYARGDDGWQIRTADCVTPGFDNKSGKNESQQMTKIELFKEKDPHGVAMAVMAMGIVFLCLALLWIFFTLFGMIMRHIDTAKKVANKQPIKPITKTVEMTAEIGRKTSNILQEGLDKKGIDIEVYMAVIGMALRQYEDDVHDVESGVITIKPKETGWDDEYSQMTHMHSPFTPNDHVAPQIPTTPELI